MTEDLDCWNKIDSVLFSVFYISVMFVSQW